MATRFDLFEMSLALVLYYLLAASARLFISCNILQQSSSVIRD